MMDAAPLSVESYRYDDRDALLAALRGGLIAQGAVVWAAVSDEAVDTDVAFESLAEKVPVERLQHGIVGDVACAAASLRLRVDGVEGDAVASAARRKRVARRRSARELDGACAYQWTPDLLRRSELLRSLLAYDKPLVLVIAGDSGCRLHDLPETHHRVVFMPHRPTPLHHCGSPRASRAWKVWRILLFGSLRRRTMQKPLNGMIRWMQMKGPIYLIWSSR